MNLNQLVNNIVQSLEREQEDCNYSVWTINMVHQKIIDEIDLFANLDDRKYKCFRAAIASSLSNSYEINASNREKILTILSAAVKCLDK